MKRGKRWLDILNTPIGTLLRGRVEPWVRFSRHRPSRPKLAKFIADAALPEPVTRLVEQVVRRTRLWPSEKLDVAEELIAHFADGLDAGEGPEELIAAFGDPRTAAKLIRSGKIRNRPLLWHAQRRCRQALVALIIVYIGMWGWLMLGKPTPTVDYLAELNRTAAAVPEEDRAWPIYREAFIKINFARLDDSDLFRPGDRLDSELLQPGDTDWPKAVAFLHAHAELLDAIRRAAAKPALGLKVGFDRDYLGDDRLALYGTRPRGPMTLDDIFGSSGPDGAKPPNYKPSASRFERLFDECLLHVHMPHITLVVRASRLIQADMRLALEEQQPERFMADYRAIQGLARHAREMPFLICDVVGRGILDRGHQAISDAITYRADLLRNSDLHSLASLLAVDDDLVVWRLDGERSSMLDLLQRIYDSQGRLTYDGLRIMSSLFGMVDALNGDATASASLPAAQMLIADRHEMQRQYERIMDMAASGASLPLWELLHRPSETREYLEKLTNSPLGRIRYALLDQLVPAMSGIWKTSCSTLAVRDALLVAIALELHRRQHGSYPGSLDDLVPTHLPKQPIDHSTGKPLLYKLVDGKPLLYGRGFDGDDDGGVATSKGINGWPRCIEEPDGDWILWPRPTPPTVPGVINPS